jgi:hypothetical protein
LKVFVELENGWWRVTTGLIVSLAFVLTLILAILFAVLLHLSGIMIKSLATMVGMNVQSVTLVFVITYFLILFPILFLWANRRWMREESIKFKGDRTDFRDLVSRTMIMLAQMGKKTIQDEHVNGMNKAQFRAKDPDYTMYFEFEQKTDDYPARIMVAILPITEKNKSDVELVQSFILKVMQERKCPVYTDYPHLARRT